MKSKGLGGGGGGGGLPLAEIDNGLSLPPSCVCVCALDGSIEKWSKVQTTRLINDSRGPRFGGWIKASHRKAHILTRVAPSKASFIISLGRRDPAAVGRHAAAANWPALALSIYLCIHATAWHAVYWGAPRHQQKREKNCARKEPTEKKMSSTVNMIHSSFGSLNLNAASLASSFSSWQVVREKNQATLFWPTEPQKDGKWAKKWLIHMAYLSKY